MKLAGLAAVRLRLVLESAHLDAGSRVLVRGFHFLWQMKLKLLREACVGECLACHEASLRVPAETVARSVQPGNGAVARGRALPVTAREALLF